MLLKRHCLAPDYRDVEPALAQAGRNLHADEARAEDHGARAAFRLREDRLRVRAAAQNENVAKPGAGNVGSLRYPASREQGRIVGEHRAVRAGNVACCGIDCAHLGGDPLDPPVMVEGLALQRRFLAALLARERVFAQDGAIIGHAVNAIEHQDTPAEPRLPQGLGRNRAGPTGAHDDETAVVVARCLQSRDLGERHQHAAICDADSVARERV